MNKKNITSINKPIVDLIVYNIPVFNEDLLVEKVIDILLEEINNYDTIDYIYIVDSKKKLKGVVSIKELLQSKKNVNLKEFTNKKLVSVNIHTEQEKVSIVALKNNLKEVPVVDIKNKFLGVVNHKSILQIMHDEGIDNMLKFGGVISLDNSFDDIFSMSIFKSIKHRLPWLIIGLIGGLFIASVINYFENVLLENLILVSFIPLIVYIASAVGTQMQSFIIRDLVLKPNLKIVKYFLKQTMVVFILGLIISCIMYIVTYFFYDNQRVSFVFFIAFIVAIMSSLFTGIVIPYLFKKLNLDPANASGPIATIIQDLMSVFIYFFIASLILL
ncbi:MAG: magnesium transporter [archaeon]